MGGNDISVFGKSAGIGNPLSRQQNVVPQKTLCWSDLKLVTVQAQGEDVETIRIKLKQPKTSRSQPTQIVELQATGGWLCLVSAYKHWQKGGCHWGYTSIHLEGGESDYLG